MSKIDYGITIGCDPELFAFKDGWPISVHDKLPGTKDDPAEVPSGAIQVDGVAAEFNILPANNEEAFFYRVTSVKRYLERLLRLSHPSVRLVAVPTAKFDETYFKSLPWQALQLGCEPDYNAYTGKENNKPSTDKPIRTGSGHVHVGYYTEMDTNFRDISTNAFKDNMKLTREFDATLLPASRLWDKDEERRELYGSPGSFRPKPYGLEYRVLSNAWLNAEDSIRYVYRLTYNVAENFLKGNSVKAELDKMDKPNSLEGLFRNFEILHLPLPPEGLCKGL